MVEQAQAEFANIQMQLLVLKEEHDLFKEKIGGSAILKRKPKIELSEKFDKDRRHFRGYITGMKNYFIHYTEEFPLSADQIWYATSYLIRNAVYWFEPKLYNYLDNITRERNNDIIAIFSLQDKYITELQVVFGDLDKDRSMKAELSRLRQTMSVGEYTSRFRQVITILEQKDTSLIDRFYKGFKKEVKDGINAFDQPEEFTAYIALATRIDIQIYQQCIEKARRGGGRIAPYPRTNQGWKRHRPSISYGTHTGSMDIGATGKTSMRHKEERDCYNGRKKDHLTRQYRISKKEGSNWKSIPNIRITEAIITTISISETKMLAVIGYKVIWIEMAQRIR